MNSSFTENHLGDMVYVMNQFKELANLGIIVENSRVSINGVIAKIHYSDGEFHMVVE